MVRANLRLRDMIPALFESIEGPVQRLHVRVLTREIN